MEYKCKFCYKFCLNANSLAQHQIRCSKNPNKIITKISDETKQKLSKVMKVANTNSSRIWKKESREKRGVASKEFNSKYWSSVKDYKTFEMPLLLRMFEICQVITMNSSRIAKGNSRQIKTGNIYGSGFKALTS